MVVVMKCGATNGIFDQGELSIKNAYLALHSVRQGHCVDYYHYSMGSLACIPVVATVLRAGINVYYSLKLT